MEGDGTGDPRDPEGEAHQQHRPADAVQHADAAADAAPQPEAEYLQAGREDAANDRRADQSDQRCIRRLGPFVEKQRRDARSENGAGREAGK